ncbi:MAG: alpha/beta fold hydrolase [Chloroflexota bacterium]
MKEGEIAEAAAAQHAPGTRGYAAVNGLNMYYEIHGAGRPLVLLHGALATIEACFGQLLPTFARTRQVIALEQQAHGRTADIDRPLTVDQMTEDTAALLRQLGVAQADLFGYSLGGAIAMEVARRYPELVRRLVFAGGASYSLEGQYSELTEGMQQMKPEDLDGSVWQQAYAKVAPRPENWHALVAKNATVDDDLPIWTPDDLRALRAPTLLIIGDADIVRPEHVVEMFRLLGGGVVGDLVGLPRARLAVLPGTTHVTLLERTDWLLSMVGEFLDASMPDDR